MTVSIEKQHGQWDHVRIYGDDFVSRLEATGLDVTAVSARDFAEDLVLTHTLAPPILSPNPLATNFRKVFFAQKLQEESRRSDTISGSFRPILGRPTHSVQTMRR